MTEDITLAFPEAEGRGRSEVPDEVAAQRGQLEASMSNLGVYQYSASSNLSSEMMAMTRALFSSLETRVARLEQDSLRRGETDQGLQNRLTKLESRLERQVKEVEEHAAANRKSLESRMETRLSSAENELRDRITVLERLGDLEERMTRLEGVVTSLEASRVDQAKMMEKVDKMEELVQFLYRDDFNRRMEEWTGLRPESRSRPANIGNTSKTLDIRQGARYQVAIPQPDESKFPQRKAIVLEDHRGFFVRRGRLGKVIVPHPKSPACNSVPEKLLFCFDKKMEASLSTA